MARYYTQDSVIDVMDTLLTNTLKFFKTLLQVLYHVKSLLPQVYSSWTAFLLDCYVLSVCFSPECGLLRILSANARLSLTLNLPFLEAEDLRLWLQVILALGNMCHQLNFKSHPASPSPLTFAREGQGPQTGLEKEEGRQEGAPKSDI